MLRLLIGNGGDALFRDLIYFGIGEGDQHGRMGGNNKLRAAFYKAVHRDDQAHDAVGRERRLGLVEDIQPLVAEAVFYRREETFAVRQAVQGGAAEPRDDGRAEREFFATVLTL